MTKIRIGTRGSKLALVQTTLVAEALRACWPGVETETVIIKTRGDKILDKPLGEIGDKGLFVSEFETALLEKRIDLAVHSAKDLPQRQRDLKFWLCRNGRMPEMSWCRLKISFRRRLSLELEVSDADCMWKNCGRVHR